ncbi:acetylornithine deacetylase [Peribacillus deserti]|uniref:Probable succinyl-diaminopimelate desuccinylase n=1 Tax=Peribacillus deserti TaxID=673318 RepID=A0ABS2QF64_9BACI|nr:M20 family metallopeptidase [Peribacillus deserti]MBM7691737.1 acetylornithine deacetylase [Peribacillus deserti]
MAYGEWVDEKRVVEVLRDLVQIPSVNPDFTGGNGEREISDYIKQFFDRLHIPYIVQLVEKNRENVIGILEGASEKHLLLEAHMDTVQVKGMTIDPFDGKIADGRLFGRGSCDTKSSLAAMLSAVESIKKKEAIPPVSVHLAAVVDEETTYKGVSFLADDIFHGKLRYDTAIIGEPTNLDIIVAHKGVIRFCVEIQGQAAHTSSPEKGVNAIENMALVIQHLKKLIVHKRGQLNHPLAGGPTLSITMIEGGVAPNTVPDSCKITIDRRTIPGEDAQEVWEEIKYSLKTIENDNPCLKLIVYEPFVIDYSMESSPGDPFVTGLLKSVAKYKPNSRITGAPYCSDASKLTRVGVPAVVFGPGNINQAHTKDEWVDLQQVFDSTKILIDTIMEFKVD